MKTFRWIGWLSLIPVALIVPWLYSAAAVNLGSVESLQAWGVGNDHFKALTELDILQEQPHAASTAAFEQALAWNPMDRAAALGIGRARALQNQTDAARVFLERGGDGAPGGDLTHFWLGLALWHNGSQAEAIREWQQSRAARFFFGKGYDYRRAAQVARAEEYLQVAIAINPTWDEPYIELVKLYWSTGQDDKLLTTAQQARARLKPGQCIYRFIDALADFTAQENAAARGKLETLFAQYPNDTDVRLVLGLVLYRQEEWQKAIDYLMPLVQMKPPSLRAIGTVGRAYLELGQYPEALRYLQPAVASGPESAVMWYSLGLAWSGVNDPAQALPAYRRAVALAPTNAVYHMRLGETYESIGQLELALAEYRTALDLDSTLKPPRAGIERIQNMLGSSAR